MRNLLVACSMGKWERARYISWKDGQHVNHKQIHPHAIMEQDYSELKDTGHCTKMIFVILHETARRTLHASIVGRCSHAKPTHGPFKGHRIQALALARCCPCQTFMVPAKGTQYSKSAQPVLLKVQP